MMFSAASNWSVPDHHSRASLLTTEFLGDIHLEQGQAEPALKLYDEVWPKALALVPKGDIVAELRRRRAECHLLLGRKDEAYAEAMTGLEHCRELGDRYEEAATYRVLAMCAAAVGKTSEARKWFEQACDSQLKCPARQIGRSLSPGCRGRHRHRLSPPRGSRPAPQLAAA